MRITVDFGDFLLLQEQHALEMKDLKEFGENETKGLKVRYCKLLASTIPSSYFDSHVFLQAAQSQMQKDTTDSFQKALMELQVRDHMGV